MATPLVYGIVVPQLPADPADAIAVTMRLAAEAGRWRVVRQLAALLGGVR